MTSRTTVTLRYQPRQRPDIPNGQVTLRYPLGPASSQAMGTTRSSPIGDLGPGSRIGAGYLVEGEPLTPTSGEADLYLCRLNGQGERLVLKLYKEEWRPDQKVMEELLGLSHPNIVRLIDQGQWQGRFYEVMHHCSGGSLLDTLPCNEFELRDLLAQIVAGLDYCHRRGIVHCDIKPGNIFYADGDRRRVCIGDFGISAHSDNLKALSLHHPQASLSLDYAAPELIDGQHLGPKADYYALGISLIQLLSGQSPFEGMRAGEILAHHLRGQIPMPQGISEPMQLLIQGLTELDPERRFGYRRVMAFLHGDFAKLQTDPYRRQAAKPYPGFPKARDSRALAANLDKFDALGQLKSGDIRRWVFDHLDSDLAEQIKPIENLANSRAQEALLQLRYLLDPQQPLQVGDSVLKTLDDLVGLLASEPKALVPAWNEGALPAWILAGQLAADQTQSLVGRIKELRQRYAGSPTNALKALLLYLDPQQAFELAPGLLLHHPNQLGDALKRQQKACIYGLRQVIFNQLFEDWLRAAEFDHWPLHLDFVARVRRDYGDQLLGAYALLWHFIPDLSLPFAGQAIRDGRVLVQLVESDEKYRQEALKLLQQGWLRAWLVGSGQMTPGDMDQILYSLDQSQETKLETLLQALAPGLEAPSMVIEPASLNFSLVKAGESRERSLKIKNKGRGHLHGRILLEHFGQGLSLGSFAIEGKETNISVQLNSLGLMPGQYHNSLRLLTNAGERTVPVSFYLQENEEKISLWDRMLNP